MARHGSDVDQEQTRRSGRRLLNWTVLSGALVLPMAVSAAANSWWEPTAADFVRMEIALAISLSVLAATPLLTLLIIVRYRPLGQTASTALVVFLVLWACSAWSLFLSSTPAGEDGVPHLERGTAALIGVLAVTPFAAAAARAISRRSR